MVKLTGANAAYLTPPDQDSTTALRGLEHERPAAHEGPEAGDGKKKNQTVYSGAP